MPDNFEIGKIPDRVVLYEVLGTRYIIPYMSFTLKRFLEACKLQYESTGKKVNVDIKHCKFNPDNHMYIPMYADYIDFCDSDNTVIDSILIHNANVSAIKKLEASGKIDIEKIPIEFDIETMYLYVSKLNRSKIYRLCSFGELNGKSPDVSILIAMSIGFLYPDVAIDISSQATNYFRMFQKFWVYTGLVHRDSYNLLWQGNILKINAVEVDRNGDNIFYIPGVGKITEDVLNANYTVIPYEFGSSNDLSNDPELCNVFDNICDELRKILMKKKKKKLTSELSTIERRYNDGDIKKN